MEDKQKGKLSLSGLMGKKPNKRKKKTTQNSVSLDENVMGPQAQDIQSYLDERLNDFKKGLMSDIVSVIDKKLKDFEIKIDGKLVKLEEDYKAMIASSAEDNKKALKDELQKDIQNQLGVVGGSVPNPLENPDVCIIASYVPERVHESPMESAEQVIAAVGSNSTWVNFSVSTNIIRAVRLNNRNPQNPALLKFAVQNLDQKVEILRCKGNLKKTNLRRVFL